MQRLTNKSLILASVLACMLTALPVQAGLMKWGIKQALEHSIYNALTGKGKKLTEVLAKKAKDPAKREFIIKKARAFMEKHPKLAPRGNRLIFKVQGLHATVVTGALAGSYALHGNQMGVHTPADYESLALNFARSTTKPPIRIDVNNKGDMLKYDPYSTQYLILNKQGNIIDYGLHTQTAQTNENADTREAQ